LAFVKQLIFKKQLALKLLMKDFIVKAQKVGVDLKATDFPEA